MMVVNYAMMVLNTAMAHNAAYSMMNNSSARMSMLNSANGQMNFRGLCEAEKNLDCQGLSDGLKFKLANVFLENNKNKGNKLDTLA
jgi:hypothetical protein